MIASYCDEPKQAMASTERSAWPPSGNLSPILSPAACCKLNSRSRLSLALSATGVEGSLPVVYAHAPLQPVQSLPPVEIADIILQAIGNAELMLPDDL